MDLKHLRYFVVVAEELSFRRAALRLKVAQPPVSRRIADLESEIGVKLFSRRERQTQLTPAGLAFLDEARAVLEKADNAVAVAKEAARGETSRVRIGYTRDASHEVLRWSLRLLRHNCPNIKPVLSLGAMRDILRDLETGKLDVGLVRTPIVSQLLEWKVLSEDFLAAVVHRDHTHAGQRAVPLSSLRNETFIILGQQYVGTYASVAYTAFREAGFQPLRVEEVDSFPALLAMVAMKRGVGLLGHLHLLREPWPDVSVVELSDVRVNTDLAAVWRKNEASLSCRKFVTLVETTPFEF